MGGESQPRPIVWIATTRRDLQAMPEAVRKGIGFALVYTVRFAEAVYVLHVFQKKSSRGAKVPRATIALLAQRLRAAEVLHNASLRETK